MKKSKLLVVSLLAFSTFGLCAAASVSQPKSFAAFAEETETETTEEEVVVEEEKDEVGEVTNKFQKIWEQYLLPAIAAVNITSLASAAVAIFFAIRNGKKYKDTNEKIKNIVQLVLELATLMSNYVKLLEERNSQMNDLVAKLDANIETTKECMIKMEGMKKGYKELKRSCIGLINIVAEFAKMNPEYVRNGGAKHIADLKNQIFSIE